MFFENGKYIITCSQLRNGEMKVDYRNDMNKKRIVVIEKSSGRAFCSQVFLNDFIFDPKDDFVFEKGVLRVFRKSRNAGWSFMMHELR